MDKPQIELIAENLITIHPLLYKSISRPVRSKTSVSPGGMFVLGCLKRHGIMSMSEIGKCLSMPKPHVTLIVDKLIDFGHVERLPDTKDRRIINISITKKGQTIFDSIRKTTSKNLKSKLLHLDEKELEILAIASEQVREILLTILSKK